LEKAHLGGLVMSGGDGIGVNVFLWGVKRVVDRRTL